MSEIEGQRLGSQRNSVESFTFQERARGLGNSDQYDAKVKYKKCIHLYLYQ